MKYKLALFSALALILASCTKEYTNGPGVDLVGSWEWQYTAGGMTGNDTILPPADANVVLELQSNNHYRTTSNGQLVVEGSYQLSEIESVFSHMPQTAITLNNPSGIQTWLVTRHEDELILSDNHVEPYHRIYQKVN